MSTIVSILYVILIIIALTCAGYNWLYKQEIRRSEKQVGITIPASFFQLLNALSFISITIAGIASVILFISFIKG